MTLGAPGGLAIAVAVVLVAGLLLGSRRGPALLLGSAAAFCLWALVADLRFGAEDAGVRILTPGADFGQPGLRWPAAAPEGIVSLAELPGDVRAVDVEGYGLPAAAWAEAEVLVADFDPPPLPRGFRELSWPTRVRPGETIRVAGVAPGAGEAVRLEVGGVLVDTGEADGLGRFDLSWASPVVGRLTATLRSRSGDTPTAEESLGISVIPAQTPTVSIELGRPGFDLRALRDWLAAGGASGIKQVQVAPEVDRTERFGAEPDAIPDLRILDGARLKALEDGDRDALLAHVRQGGGLLVLPRGEALPAWLGVDFTPLASSEEVTVRVAETELQGRRYGRLIAGEDDAVFLRDTSGLTLGMRASRGAGGITVLDLAGTAAWRTTGAAAAHAAFWDEVVLGATGLRQASHWVRPSELVPTVGQRTLLCGSGTERPVVNPAPSLPLLAFSRGENARCFAWWPDNHGWHDVAGHAVFAYRVDALLPDRARHRIDATAALRIAGDLAPAPEPASRRLTWWLLFILFALGLFAEQRLRSP